MQGASVMESTGNAALDRNLDDDVYDFTPVTDLADRERLEAAFVKLCRRRLPISLEDAKLLCKWQFLELARRDAAVLAALKARMTETKKRWSSTADMIRHRFFGVEARLDGEGRLSAAPLPADEQRWAWMPNEFPYLCEAGIEHWLLWMNVRVDDAEIERQIAQRVPTGSEYCWAPQKTECQTIPAIFHVQVFVRRPQS
jgi:hypothetical protein